MTYICLTLSRVSQRTSTRNKFEHVLLARPRPAQRRQLNGGAIVCTRVFYPARELTYHFMSMAGLCTSACRRKRPKSSCPSPKLKLAAAVKSRNALKRSMQLILPPKPQSDLSGRPASCSSRTRIVWMAICSGTTNGGSAHIKERMKPDVEREYLEVWIGVHGAILHNAGAGISCMPCPGDWCMAEKTTSGGMYLGFHSKAKKPPTGA